MAHLLGYDRNQTLLLPPSVEEYVGEENPVRFIEAFVDGLDLNAAGFVRVEAKETGRPGYDPADLLKLYIYGYLNRVRSSRRLEAETQRNLEVIWLVRQLRPDFKTIADFRKDNAKAFKTVFREFVLFCNKLELFGRELLAVDGTRLKAVNSRERSFTKKKLTQLVADADKRLADYLERLERCDKVEASVGQKRAEKLKQKIATLEKCRVRDRAMLKELEESGQAQRSLTDPDSRLMATYPKVGVGYNAQVAVDSKHSLIVEQEITNAGSDLGLLAQTATAAKATLRVDKIKVVADTGYYKSEDILACEQAGIEAYVARAQRGSAVEKGLFRKEEFIYQADKDGYLCPAGKLLDSKSYVHSRGEGQRIYYYNQKACKGCQLRSRCTSTSSPYARRQVTRWEHEEVLDRMEQRLEAAPEMLKKRRIMVEHPFGTIKQWMNQGAFLMKRIENVRGEFSLTALAYNLIRVINILGVRKLMEAAA